MAIDDLEKRIKALESRLDSIEPQVRRSMPIGPGIEREKELEAQGRETLQKICEGIQAKREKEVPAVDRSAQQLTDGSPVPQDHSHRASANFG